MKQYIIKTGHNKKKLESDINYCESVVRECIDNKGNNAQKKAYKTLMKHLNRLQSTMNAF